MNGQKNDEKQKRRKRLRQLVDRYRPDLLRQIAAARASELGRWVSDHSDERLLAVLLNMAADELPADPVSAGFCYRLVVGTSDYSEGFEVTSTEGLCGSVELADGRHGYLELLVVPEDGDWDYGWREGGAL